MVRFVDCGELSQTNGRGLSIPLILNKSGIISGDFRITSEFVEDGKLNFPVEIKEVGGDFICYDAQLISLDGCPKKVGGDFNIKNNARKFTEEEVRAVCNVKGKVIV